MDAPLWTATSYGMLEVETMNNCLNIVDVPSLEVFRDRLGGTSWNVALVRGVGISSRSFSIRTILCFHDSVLPSTHV